METIISPEELGQLDPATQMHIANLAKCGIKWTPPSKRPEPTEPSVKEVIQPSSLDSIDPSPSLCKEPKFPRKSRPSGPDLPPEPESDSELMGSAYQDKLASAKKARFTLTRGPLISRAEATKLDAEAFEDLGLKPGEKADRLETFVPWRFLVRYAVSTCPTPAWPPLYLVFPARCALY